MSGRRPSRLQALLSGHGWPLSAAALAFAGLLAATLWMWSSARDEAQRAAEARFQFRVSEIRVAVHQRLLAYEQVLRGGVGLFAASDEVRRDEWRQYVHTLAIDSNFSGIQGIGFAKRILPAQLEAHLAAVRGEGFSGYALRPAGEREEYTSIIYLEPFDWRNQRAFGYDMFSEPVRREAMIRARDTGLPALSGKVQLVQETERDVQHGFLMYLPVYHGDLPDDTVEARRAALAGYVYAPFRMADLMGGILSTGAPPDIDFHIHDGTGEAPETLLYDSVPGHERDHAATRFSAVSTMEINGREWTLSFKSLPAFDSAIDTQKPRLILVGGTLVSLSFAAFVWSSALNRRRARQVADANRVLQEEVATRTRLAGELEQAKNAAEAANEAKSAFLAAVSHELRTPLTLILAPLDALRAEGSAGGRRSEHLARIERNALVLLNRVNDLLDFSKAEAGKFDVRWEHLDPAQVVAAIAEDAAPVAAHRGCRLAWREDPALGPVCVDRGHLEKIVLNLVDNALKFTPAGGRIDIEVKAIDADWFSLEVSDTGVGIPADRQATLFTRFQQVDGSATRRYGGTGIGLALVKELAELMGGEVGLESAPGTGSRFRVRLPRAGGLPAADAGGMAPEAAAGREVAQARLRRARFGEGTALADASPAAPDTPPDGAAPASPAGSTRARPAAGGGGAAPCVLVADDHPDMRDYLAGLLAADYRVVLAEDGVQAWERVREQAVDVVVSDVMMPGMDGLELAARIKGDPTLAHVPVILVTARGGPEACVSGLQGGADDYLAKPFAPAELCARVRAALRLAHAQALLRERAREAGMATVAAGVLHNLGNALAGVNIASGNIEERLQQSRVSRLHQLARILRERGHASPGEGGDGASLPDYVAALADHLDRERRTLLDEVATLRRCATHAGEVVASHQRFARSGEALRERLSADGLMEAALDLAHGAFGLEDTAVERDYACSMAVEADRHLALQILLNLLSNAAHALAGVPDENRRIRVSTRASLASPGKSAAGGGPAQRSAGWVLLEVEDNGAGVEPDLLPLLFDQGFTTRGEGHGYGLHSSANWARELGGSLVARSGGPGRGAVFILSLPAASSHDTPSSPCPAVAV